MHKSTWKKKEQRNADLFGTTRNPLSGGNARHSRSDSIHGALYLECKHVKVSAVWTLHDDAKKKAKIEGKTPVLLLGRKGSPGVIVCVHSDNIETMIQEYKPRQRIKGAKCRTRKSSRRRTRKRKDS